MDFVSLQSEVQAALSQEIAFVASAAGSKGERNVPEGEKRVREQATSVAGSKRSNNERSAEVDEVELAVIEHKEKWELFRREYLLQKQQMERQMKLRRLNLVARYQKKLAEIEAEGDPSSYKLREALDRVTAQLAESPREVDSHTSAVCSRVAEQLIESPREADSHSSAVCSRVADQPAEFPREAESHSSAVAKRVTDQLAESPREADSHSSAVCIKVADQLQSPQEVDSHTSAVFSRVAEQLEESPRETESHSSAVANRVTDQLAESPREADSHSSAVCIKVADQLECPQEVDGQSSAVCVRASVESHCKFNVPTKAEEVLCPARVVQIPTSDFKREHDEEGSTSIQDRRFLKTLENGVTRREDGVAVKDDVQGRFHLFHVAEEDRDLLQFLWWDDEDSTKAAVEYWMKIYFGSANSPGCANSGIKKAVGDRDDGTSSTRCSSQRRRFRPRSEDTHGGWCAG